MDHVSWQVSADCSVGSSLPSPARSARAPGSWARDGSRQGSVPGDLFWLRETIGKWWWKPEENYRKPIGKLWFQQQNMRKSILTKHEETQIIESRKNHWKFLDSIIWATVPYKALGIFPYLGLLVGTSNLGSWDGHWVNADLNKEAIKAMKYRWVLKICLQNQWYSHSLSIKPMLKRGHI